MGFNSEFKGLRMIGGIRPMSRTPAWRPQGQLFTYVIPRCARQTQVSSY